jgi:tetratricopeptide (TPR) repeat protein
MRYNRIILFGLGLALSVSAQELLPDANTKTNTTSDLGLRVDSERVRSGNKLPTLPILTEGFSEGQIGVPDTDESGVTNKVVDSKLRFFMSAGLEYADEGEFEEADRAYQRALEIDPDNEDILFRQATMYVHMERFTDAVEIFEKLAERFPENPLPHNNLAWCYATSPEVRNVKKALRHAREALISAPQNPSMWNTLAEAYYVAGDYDKALRSTDYALEILQRINPEDEKIESFLEQRSKIILAQDALKMLEGFDSEDD